MVLRLLNALSTPPEATEDETVMRKKVDSVVSRLGMYLKLALQPKSEKKPNDDPQEQRPPPPTNATAAVSPDDEDDATPETVPSPPRRRLPTRSSAKRGDKAESDARTRSPAQSSRQQQQKESTSPAAAPPDYFNDYRIPTRPTTDFLGWRRLHLREIIQLQKGDHIIVVIPSNLRTESKHITKARNDFRSRVVTDVMRSCRDTFKQQKDWDNQSDSHKRKIVSNHIHEVSGIDRNGNRYIELPCKIEHYARRTEYVRDLLDDTEIDDLLRADGGFNLSMRDYPSLSSTLLKWTEVGSIQIFVPHYRGDPRPQIDLGKRRRDILYYQEIEEKFDAVKDDVIQMLELTLSFERKRVMILNTVINDLRKKLQQQTKLAKAPPTLEDFLDVMEEELEDGAIATFANESDLIYKDAIVEHQTGSLTTEQLLADDYAMTLFQTIEGTFPMHFHAIRSLIFNKRAHAPSRSVRSGYAEKQKSLVNHFLALLRLRQPSYMLHWAIIGTISMVSNGVCMTERQYRNRSPALHAFSVDLKTMYNHLGVERDGVKGMTDAKKKKEGGGGAAKRKAVPVDGSGAVGAQGKRKRARTDDDCSVPRETSERSGTSPADAQLVTLPDTNNANAVAAQGKRKMARTDDDFSLPPETSERSGTSPADAQHITSPDKNDANAVAAEEKYEGARTDDFSIPWHTLERNCTSPADALHEMSPDTNNDNAGAEEEGIRPLPPPPPNTPCNVINKLIALHDDVDVLDAWKPAADTEVNYCNNPSGQQRTNCGGVDEDTNITALQEQVANLEHKLAEMKKSNQQQSTVGWML